LPDTSSSCVRIIPVPDFTKWSWSLIAVMLALQLGAAYANKYGLIYKVHIGPTACLVVTDPEEVSKLTSNSNRTANLPKLTEAYRIHEAVGINAGPYLCSDCVIVPGVKGDTLLQNYVVSQ